MLKSIRIFCKDLHRGEKCCNFASAIGKRTAGGSKERGSPPDAKIENNDMMPQDKQRQSNGLDAARDKGTRVLLGVSVKKIPSLNKEGGRDNNNFEDIYNKIYN